MMADTGLGAELTAVADRLREITVVVQGTRSAFGAGVLWRAGGLVVTNAHVARGDATVIVSDGRVLGASLLARDDACDLAALDVGTDRLPAAQTRETGTLRVGELLFAIGHPLGLPGALTAGVVHALERGDARGDLRWVQADLRLAPGNSGGPLADAGGRVVGICTMVAGGLALAVPSNAVELFLARINPVRARAWSAPAAAPRNPP
jgi:serine protease Do